MTNHKFIVRFLVLLLFFCSISCHQTIFISELAKAETPALHPLTGRPLSPDFLWDPMSASFDTLDPVLTQADLLFQIPGQNGFLYYAVWGSLLLSPQIRCSQRRTTAPPHSPFLCMSPMRRMWTKTFPILSCHGFLLISQRAISRKKALSSLWKRTPLSLSTIQNP